MSRRTSMVLLAVLAGISCWVGAQEARKGLPDAIFAAGFENTRPVANAGADRSVVVGTAATLSGSGVDPEGGALSYAWQVLSQPAGSNLVLTNPATATPGFTPLVLGLYRFELVVSDGALLSVPDAVEITAVESVGPPPVANAGAAQTVLRGVQVQLSGAGSSDPRNLPLTYAWSVDAVPDGASVSLDRPTAVDPRFTATVAGLYRLRLQVGNGLTVSAPSLVEISAVPPAVEGVAPPLPTTGVTPPAAATRFLYTGPDPIQTGVVAGAIDELRGATVSGRVVTRTDVPLPGVTVRVLGRPELGRTVTRADGRFDLAVNGGDSLVLDFTRSGLLGVQRRVKPDWQGQRVLDRVVMIAPDAAATRVSFGRNAGGLLARGSESRDKDGVRRARVFVPPGSEARVVLADGRSVGSLTTATLRITEYTVGALGENTMPGDLPPTTAYTYAAEIGIDEPVSKEATRVEFGQTLWSYVDNFVGFPVGEVVPSGYYDRDRGVWVPARNGRVLKVLSVTGGLAVLDVTGSGLPATPQELQDLGITDAERTELAGTFAAGQSFWRTPLEFLPARGGGAGAPWDYNWPYGPPPDALPPGVPPPFPPQPPPPKVPECKLPRNPGIPEDACNTGSVIQCQQGTMQKAVPVAGTLFSLHYNTERAPGWRQDILRIPMTGATIPASAANARVSIEVAGRSITQTQPIAPNQTLDFSWNGRDAWNRPLTGTAEAKVRVGYEYPAVYYATRGSFNQSFATLAGVPISRGGSQVAGRATTTLWTEHRVPLADDVPGPSALVAGLGGFTLTPHHAYDPVGRRLYRGDGTIVDGANASSNSMVRTLGGTTTPLTGCSDPNGDGGPASNASFRGIEDLAVGPDGSIYLADQGRLRRIAPDGIIATIAGGGSVFPGAPTPGASAALDYVFAVTVDSDGNVYAATHFGRYVARLDSSGMIQIIAGRGVSGGNPPGCPNAPCGDGGPALEATFRSVYALAVGPDGSLYIADGDAGNVRRIGADGIITTVAGTGEDEYTGPNGPVGDGGPAIQALLRTPLGIDVSPEGDLYIADYDNRRVRKVDISGRISTVAGTGEQYVGPNPPRGDFGPAVDAVVDPVNVVVLPDGDLAVFDYGQNRVRVIGETGTITTLVGGGNGSGEGRPGPGTRFFTSSFGIAALPDGRVLFAGDVLSGGQYIEQIHAVGPAFPGLSLADLVIPAPDGTESYRFSSAGRHLDTRDTVTGAIRYQFTYDAAGRLIGIMDGDGNLARIERNAAGAPTAIVSPDNLRTELALDANGLLASVTNPLAEQVRMEYAAGGLLNRYVDARGFASTYTYDVNGLIVTTRDALGGGMNYSRSSLVDGGTLVTARTTLGQTTTYRTTNLSGGGQVRRTTFPDGTTTEVLIGNDGVSAVIQPDGTRTEDRSAPNPSVPGAAFIGRQSVSSGGQTSTREMQRTGSPGTGNATEQITVNSRVVQRQWDAGTRTSTLTTPQGRTDQTILDAQRRPVRLERPGLATVEFTYNARGEMTSVTSGSGPDARTLGFEFDARGHLQARTDALGRRVTYVRDALGQILEVIRPDGQREQFAYDANGNLVSRKYPGRAPNVYEYTAVNMLASFRPPSPVAGKVSGGWSYTYNADQQLTRMLRPDGKSVERAYDSMGRTTTVTIDRGAVNMRYHPVTGDLTEIEAPGGIALRHTYAGGLLSGAEWTGPVAGRVNYAYDSDFRVREIRVNGANPIAITYTADGPPASVGGLALTYAADSGLYVGSTIGTISDAYTLNQFGEPTVYVVTRGGAAVFRQEATRDKLGRITRLVETVEGVTRTFDYAYTVTGNLEQVRADGVVIRSLTYDANGNILTRTDGGQTVNHTYDDQGRLLSAGATTFTYSAAGEVQTAVEGGAVTNYTHDALGKLTQVDLPDGRSVSYLIDGANRPVGKRVNGVLSERFLYDNGSRTIAELDAGGAVVTRYVYVGESPEPAYMLNGGRTYRLITDLKGDMRLMLDTASGDIALRVDYDEFGKIVAQVPQVRGVASPQCRACVQGVNRGYYDPDSALFLSPNNPAYDAIRARMQANRDYPGAMLYPGGRERDINDFVGKNGKIVVVTNGILGNRREMQDLANKSNCLVYFNPSNGPLADIAESTLQRFKIRDDLAAGLARDLQGRKYGITFCAHSQGTLTVTNLVRMYGFNPRGSEFVLRSPALMEWEACPAIRRGGGTCIWRQPWGDIANLYAPDPWRGAVNALEGGLRSVDIHIKNGFNP